MEFLRSYTEEVEKALVKSLLRLPEPARPVAAHILGAGGKRLRPLLTVLCANMLGYCQPDIYELACSLEMLHAATLLHDDVLDNAASRRGKQAAHAIFGNSRAILAGDALLAAGNAQVADFANPALSMCYSRATMETANGEILEMDSLRRPALTLNEYLDIARGKTGCLIAEACVMGALAAAASPEQIASCEAYGQNLGLAFQLVDDALDFAPESQTGKPAGGDLREGKMTPPLRFYRQSLDLRDREEFDLAFAAGSLTEDQIKAVIATARQKGFDEATRVLADTHLENARDALTCLPQGRENEILLVLTDYVRDRRK